MGRNTMGRFRAEEDDWTRCRQGANTCAELGQTEEEGLRLIA
eukprot:NODE_1456_length_597_cov_674.144161_g1162_i0.p4 GENE.NODE_1456_length_597_cov_674.144161_g1162_i0~~NODE_1456_length_597_cov_674.144161_g1162_i0.p4  ORF type:complete len:51 (+),score=24.17 NODE_1456_length_597_cov_674.144161_g1162_i0:29-154(+)